MGVTVTYGSYQHADNEVIPTSFNETFTYTSRLRPDQRVKRLVLEGMLLDSTVAGLTTKLNALESAYRENNKDLIIKDPNGTTSSPLSLFASTAEVGPLVRLSIPMQASQGHWATGVPYRIEAEARYNPGSLTADTLISYTDSISQQGNHGPEFIPIETDTGTPEAQQISQASSVIITQQGNSVGRNQYFEATPIFDLFTPGQGVYPIAKAQVDRRQTSRVRGKTLTAYPSTWSYRWFAVTAQNLPFPNPSP